MSTSTPWGMSQQSVKIATGIMSYSTASHGGVHLSKKRNALVPDYMRSDNGWYEEDCEHAIPCVVFTDEYKKYYADLDIDIISVAKDTLLSYYPDEYEKFYNVTLVEGQSYERDQQIAKERHKNDYIVVSALDTTNDMLKVFATIGGELHTDKGKYFNVPLAEYKAKRGAFVIKLNEHAEIIK